MPCDGFHNTHVCYFLCIPVTHWSFNRSLRSGASGYCPTSTPLKSSSLGLELTIFCDCTHCCYAFLFQLFKCWVVHTWLKLWMQTTSGYKSISPICIFELWCSIFPKWILLLGPWCVSKPLSNIYLPPRSGSGMPVSPVLFLSILTHSQVYTNMPIIWAELHKDIL